MTLTQIRNRIHALQRRFGLPLTIIRLRPYATQFCHQWAVAHDRTEPLPETPPFIRKLADAGFHLTTFMYLHHHLKRHRENNTCPQPSSIVAALVPGASARKIIDAVFQWDPLPAPSQLHDPATPPSSPMLCFSPPFRSAQRANGQRATGNGANTLTSAPPRHLPIDASPLHRYHYPQNTQQAREWE